jgi:hypothetical protein
MAAYADRPGSAALPVRIDADTVARLAVGKRIRLGLPDQSAILMVDRLVRHQNGDRTVVGHLQGLGHDYRIVLTVGNSGSSGIIRTRSRSLLLRPDTDGDWLIDTVNSGYRPAPAAMDDAPLPPRGGAGAPPAEPAPQADTQSSPGSLALVDLMLLYTPGLVSRYGSVAAVETRLNNLLEIANQTYLDSGVAVALRLVHHAQVPYTDTTTNARTLDELTAGRTPFAEVESWRRQYGADLVSLVRSYSYPVQGNCGIAWQLGANGRFAADDLEYTYSVVSDGEDAESRRYCNDYVLVHELGHNMGSAHDRDHTLSSGIFNYSFGFGSEGEFGTIMSYIQPLVGRFSSPTLTCAGRSCGVPIGQSGEADNVGSLNAVRAQVAAFRREVLPLPQPAASRLGVMVPARSSFHLRNSLSAGPADTVFRFGLPNSSSLALAGDWNGNAIDTIGLYNPATSRFLLRNDNTSGSASRAFAFGARGAGWLPVAGDWDGDGVATVGLYDPQRGRFLVKNEAVGGKADVIARFGPKNARGWLPLVGDWDGDEVDGIGVYDPRRGIFILRGTADSGPPTNGMFRFGPRNPALIPLAGDWNGDGRATIGIYDPERGQFKLRNSNTPGTADITVRYGPGSNGALPLAGDWDGAVLQ